MDEPVLLNVQDISSLPKLSIRGVIQPDGFAIFSDESTFSAAKCAKFLEDNADAPKVVVEISSPGGFVSEGFEIYDLLKASGKEVITIGYSVSSIAVVVFLAGKKRYVSENCQFVIHNARIPTEMLGPEPLTASDLSRLAEETARTDSQILNHYCSVLGEDDRGKLLALMAADTDLGAKNAIKYGFAHGYWAKKTEGAKQKNLCITEIAINIIDKMEKEKLNSIEKMLNNVMSFFKHNSKKMKNDVSGATVHVYSDTDDLVGKDAVIVLDGVPTSDPAPDGEHTLSDGRVIVVAGGKVTEVKDVVDAEGMKKELEAANAKVADQTAKITELENKLAEQSTLNKDLEVKVTNVVQEFEKFKKQVPGDLEGKETKHEKQEIEFKNMSRSQRLYHMRKKQD